MKLDRRIPYCNVLMRCRQPARTLSCALPEGYCFHFFQPGDEVRWAEIEADIGDFASREEALRYFTGRYLPHREALSQRCFFVLDRAGRAVGTCMAWRDPKGEKEVSSLHWLAVLEDCQGRGLGKALLNKALSLYADWEAFPVYLHTQPWSYRAVGLYSRAGFHLLKSDSFSDYQNQTEQALEVLRPLLSKEAFDKLLREME